MSKDKMNRPVFRAACELEELLRRCDAEILTVAVLLNNLNTVSRRRALSLAHSLRMSDLGKDVQNES